MNKYNFRSYKIEALWLRIESFFNNIIYLEWSLSSFCLSLFDFTQTFIRISSQEFQAKINDQGKFYLFAFFGIANQLMNDIDSQLNDYIWRNHKNYDKNNINIFNKDFKKWLKIVENFSKTELGKELMILIEKKIQKFQKLIEEKNQYNQSFFLKKMCEKGEKIFNLERMVHDNYKIQNYKILSIDKNYFQKRKN